MYQYENKFSKGLEYQGKQEDLKMDQQHFGKVERHQNYQKRTVHVEKKVKREYQLNVKREHRGHSPKSNPTTNMLEGVFRD